jgi:RNA polymerase sigma-70 factor (ECF subfamily)
MEGALSRNVFRRAVNQWRTPGKASMDLNPELGRLRAAVASGDGSVMDELLSNYRDRLRRMVRLRMDQRLFGRVDPSDVIQEAYLEAFRRLDEYLANPQVSFFLWLRFLTGQQLSLAHRRHLGIQARDANREISLHHSVLPAANSAMLAAQLVGQLTSPSMAAMRTEQQLKLQEALNVMAPIDREVLVLRHFDQLSNIETAEVLGIRPTAASNRYVRAIERLRDVLASSSSRRDDERL